jgi:hypothetical protein
MPPRLGLPHLGRPLAGRLDRHEFMSAALADNPLDDPAIRPLEIYTPPGYDDSDERYPTVYVLQGYTGSLPMWHNRAPWRPTLVEACDAMFVDEEAPLCILVLVDAWTSYGGSQFVDSPGTGRYHTYLCDEIVPYVDEHYRTHAEAAFRGVAGKSSGGLGAMITPMLRPDLFGGLATHAGDALYELLYVPMFARVARALRDDYDGDYDKFWTDFVTRAAEGRAESKSSDGELTMTYGCAAAFSAREDGTVELPFEVATGRLIPEVWDRWLAWDPVRMVDRYADAVRGLRAVWIDAGTRDDWFLDLGAESFRRELVAHNAPTDGTLHFELFDATHSAIGYRYPPAIRFLTRHLG